MKVEKKDLNQADQALRDVGEFTFNWDPLFSTLEKAKSKVAVIEVVMNPEIIVTGKSLIEWKKTLPMIKEISW